MSEFRHYASSKANSGQQLVARREKVGRVGCAISSASRAEKAINWTFSRCWPRWCWCTGAHWCLMPVVVCTRYERVLTERSARLLEIFNPSRSLSRTITTANQTRGEYGAADQESELRMYSGQDVEQTWHSPGCKGYDEPALLLLLACFGVIVCECLVSCEKSKWRDGERKESIQFDSNQPQLLRSRVRYQNATCCTSSRLAVPTQPYNPTQANPTQAGPGY